MISVRHREHGAHDDRRRVSVLLALGPPTQLRDDRSLRHRLHPRHLLHFTGASLKPTEALCTQCFQFRISDWTPRHLQCFTCDSLGICGKEGRASPSAFITDRDFSLLGRAVCIWPFHAVEAWCGKQHNVVVFQGGMYMLQLMDSYAATYAVLIIALVECLALSWVYGTNSLLDTCNANSCQLKRLASKFRRV